MFSVLKKIGVLGFVIGLSALGALGCGTSSEDACDIICTKSAECQPGVTKNECVTTCKAQAEEEATADALIEQSECYEDATCSEISSGGCVPQEV